MQYEIGFIGCGNMGGALVRAVAKAVNASQIAVCDYSKEKAETLAKTLGVCALGAKELAQNSKMVVLGVKPQNMQETVGEIANNLQENKNAVVITMAAGVPISKIREYAKNPNLPVVRIMPNTPASLGEGMILYDCARVDKQDETRFLELFSKAGVLDKLDEDKIDAGCALSGSGPAFVYAFAKALATAANECGIPNEKALKYAAQTLVGGAKMLQEHGDADALIKAVCSPNGTTVAGMGALEKGNFEEVAKSAVHAAYNRAKELANG